MLLRQLTDTCNILISANDISIKSWYSFADIKCFILIKYHSYQLLNQYETKLTNDMWYCGLIKKYPDEQTMHWVLKNPQLKPL